MRGVVAILRLFTEALGVFLVSRLSELPEKPVASFAMPGGVAGKNALNIFLYAMEEDAEKRSSEKQFELKEEGWISTEPPLRLKCTYMISAWSAEANPESAALSQISMLSAAYKVFASAKTLPATYMPAQLNTPGLPKPVIGFAENALPGNPDFWISAGCAFRPSFSVNITVSLPVPTESYDDIVEGIQTGYIIR
jgi:hypothetical protein